MGKEGGLSSGVSEDLAYATKLARLMIQKYGMSEDFGLVSFDSNYLEGGSLTMKICQLVDSIVKKELEERNKVSERK